MTMACSLRLQLDATSCWRSYSASADSRLRSEGKGLQNMQILDKCLQSVTDSRFVYANIESQRSIKGRSRRWKLIAKVHSMLTMKTCAGKCKLPQKQEGRRGSLTLPLRMSTACRSQSECSRKQSQSLASRNQYPRLQRQHKLNSQDTRQQLFLLSLVRALILTLLLFRNKSYSSSLLHLEALHHFFVSLISLRCQKLLLAQDIATSS